MYIHVKEYREINSEILNFYNRLYVGDSGANSGLSFVPNYANYYNVTSDNSVPSSPVSYDQYYKRQPDRSSQLSVTDYGKYYGSLPPSINSPQPAFNYDQFYKISPSGSNPAKSPTGGLDYSKFYANLTPSATSTSSRSYLDSSAKLKVSDYKLDPLELDTAIKNIENKPISVLQGSTVKKYYQDLSSSTAYSNLLTTALNGKITNKEELAKVGYFRKHLYENELSQIFSSSSPVGERRNAYEILVNAINKPLNIQDVNNPVNVEMQNVVMPEMMKLMANDGYKITVKKAGVSKAYEANKSDATKEFTFDLDDMNWRTQITDPEFTNYASKVIENLKNPSAKAGYVGMYQKDVLEQRKSFETGLDKLKNKQAELSSVISASSVDRANIILSTTVKNLDLILTDRLAYGSVYQSYEMAKNQLGDDNVFKTLIIKLASQGEFTVQSSKDRNKSIKVNINNILGVEDGTNLHLLDNKAVLEELSKRLKNTYK
ncbi:MAG: hypothetical protein ACOYK1_01380 [Vampirovibrionia bacterium]